MRAAFSPDEEMFRDEVAAFLGDYRHIDGFYDQAHRWPEVKALFQAMGARGWLALAWPRELGGLEKPISYEYILWDEVGYARAARNPLSAGVVARSIIRFGTEEQKQRWLPAIRSGGMHFSLGYSEPEAGSDLAAVRCRAERRGDVYVVTGQKCWQSYAEDMDYLWLLCRTGEAGSRSGGLTLLIVDLKDPGVTVGPLPTIDGHQLNEIHLDGVEVPVAQRVGPEGGAWKIMSEALADERHIQFPPKRVRRDLEEIIEWVREMGLAEDALVRRTLAELATQLREVEMHGLLVLHAMQTGQLGLVEAAANKVAYTVVCQNIARAALEFGGPHALVRGTRVEHLWRQTMWETIGGGTSEIMLSVVARQSLGLGGRN